jgi:hypothetical protein
MNVDVDWVRKLCLSFPKATEQVTWGANLTFRNQRQDFCGYRAGTGQSVAFLQVFRRKLRGTYRAGRHHPGAVYGAGTMGCAGDEGCSCKRGADRSAARVLRPGFREIAEENAGSVAAGAQTRGETKTSIRQTPQTILILPTVSRSSALRRAATSDRPQSPGHRREPCDRCAWVGAVPRHSARSRLPILFLPGPR